MSWSEGSCVRNSGIRIYIEDRNIGNPCMMKFKIQNPAEVCRIERLTGKALGNASSNAEESLCSDI